MRATLAERFWAKVDKRGPDECWLWRGSCGGPHAPYGQIRMDGRLVGAHRASYLLAHGALEPELEVIHSCDVKLCVNPAHLRQDTHAENMRESSARGLHSRGGDRWSAKLTEEKAIFALAANRQGLGASDLAHLLRVPRPLIQRLLRGDTWRHLPRVGAQ